MVRTTIVDTGALIASINKKDQYHRWAQKRAKKLPLPFLTCEAVLSEVWFLLRRFPIEQEKVLRLLEKKEIVVELHADCQVFSTDADFNVYRRHGDQIIPALLPPS
jgi:uncharacterized protein